jgi:hypothetical protein
MLINRRLLSIGVKNCFRTAQTKFTFVIDLCEKNNND